MSKFRTAYDKEHVRSIIRFELPSRTKQEFKDQCDMNLIVQNFLKTGRLDQIDQAKAQYLDLAATPQSYQESLNLVIGAADAFSSLPANIRAAYDNSVSVFLEAAYHDPDAVFGSTKPVQADPASQATHVAQPPANPPVAPPQPQPSPVATPPQAV